MRPEEPTQGNPLASLPNKVLKLNVGGKVFEVNSKTLQAAGDGSLLAQVAEDAFKEKRSDVFIDRDPHLFQTLLSILRSNSSNRPLPPSIDLDLLIEEAHHYGMLPALQASIAPPVLDGLDIEKVRALLSNGRDFPSAISTLDNGSLCLGHGSKVTLYDWALRRLRTTLTELSRIDCLHMLSDTRAALGSSDMPGLHVYDVVHGHHVKSFMWSDAQDPRVFKPCVHAIASSPTAVFASFKSSKSGDNIIGVVDPEKLEVMDEIGRQGGLSSMVSTKLEWIGNRGLLAAGATAGGAFGHTGHLRLFDVRSKEQVWEWKEPNMTLRPQDKDSFADWGASEELDVIFKIGVTSGRLELLDLRMMELSPAPASASASASASAASSATGKEEPEDPWMLMQETRSSLAKGEGGASNLLAVSGRQVFCSRGGDLEVWSEVPLQLGPHKEFWETCFRRNYLDQRRNFGAGHTITTMATGGNRLFVARKELQGVEVWETVRLYRP